MHHLSTQCRFRSRSRPRRLFAHHNHRHHRAALISISMSMSDDKSLGATCCGQLDLTATAAFAAWSGWCKEWVVQRLLVMMQV